MTDRPIRPRSGIPPIKAWMTPFPFSIAGREPLSRAREMFLEHGFRHLPVTEGENLVGVVSDREIELALDRAADGASATPTTVREIAVEAFVIDLSAPADQVLLEMAKRQAGSALVTRHGRLVGIFTVTDACRCFGEWLRVHFLPPDGDHAA